MSMKWPPFFRKKGNKADSHGTTAADEDIQFQPVPPHANDKVTKLSSVQSQVSNCDTKHPGESFPSQRSSFKDKSARGGPEVPRNDTSDWSGEGLRNLQLKDDENREFEERGSNEDINASNAVGARPASVMPAASHKTLTKPGTTTTAQRNYQPAQRQDVSISDEYSDPYDALRQKEIQKRNAVTDGYIEPYKAQEIFHNAVQSHGDAVDYDQDRGSEQDHYQDPWDKRTGDADYTSAQSRNETLLYNPTTKKNHQSGFAQSKRQTGLMDMGNSWGSGDISNGSDSPNSSRRRLVRVEPPRGSPRSSPQFDRRLILPEGSGSSNLDNYSEPWGRQVKFKPVDKRLIKAEPSLEELRRMSPSGHNSSIGTSSPGSSGRGSPVGTLQPGLDLIHIDNTRRSSSPMAPGYPGLPPNLILHNKSKSRSLDLRNHPQPLTLVGRRNIAPASRFPKSASDEQLVGHNMGSAGNIYRPQTQGMSDYEEPWDKSQRSQTLVNNHGKLPPVSHIRSRSYEINHHSSSANDYLAHESSFYEQPWDKNSTNHHLQSIQRFQQRKLELHPSEAINTRDFDPLLPLEKQMWYHAGITRGEAEKRLMSRCEGSYLVRKSESNKNSFSLSVQTRIGCIHMLMRCTRDGSWILGEFSSPFLSAPEMVLYYTRQKLKINDSDYVLLLYPVPDTDIL